ncbi:unnamed protein product [Ambrosiozyma monospora]|uniref:Unnamed protein product n=1 Tax=Ambrosiozyma monospora TaxID=43982 RepID=A0ACB5T6H4_AMBMO|nr:unnamed protein product [Ambrosiozyma monospora]
MVGKGKQNLDVGIFIINQSINQSFFKNKFMVYAGVFKYVIKFKYFISSIHHFKEVVHPQNETVDVAHACSYKLCPNPMMK